MSIYSGSSATVGGTDVCKASSACFFDAANVVCRCRLTAGAGLPAGLSTAGILLAADDVVLAALVGGVSAVEVAVIPSSPDSFGFSICVASARSASSLCVGSGFGGCLSGL